MSLTLRNSVLLGSAVAFAAGCFQSNGRGDAGDAAAMDGAPIRDGGRAADGDTSAMDGDAGTCAPLGSTRLCGPYCQDPCPEGAGYCSEFWNACFSTLTADPRGREKCTISPNLSRYCFSGSLCVTGVEPQYEGPSWGGPCVSEEYCRWIETRPELAHHTCRYSDGSTFESGPPSDACAPGALPENPFCGGACGDQCPADPFMTPETRWVSCVGMSETRGFGVCVTDSSFRCGPSVPSPDDAFTSCRAALQLLTGRDVPCVCMLLSPVEVEEFAGIGWTVSEQTCLAYQERYPGEVRCLAENAM